MSKPELVEEIREACVQATLQAIKEDRQSHTTALLEALEGEKKKYKGDNWMIAAADGQYNDALDKAKQIISEYFTN